MAAPTDFQTVVSVKKMLLDGHTPSAVARFHNLHIETVRRIKRGETRQQVVVKGEDRLRQPIDVEGMALSAAPADVPPPTPSLPTDPDLDSAASILDAILNATKDPK